ncbi:MAG: GNAT family N-acetyltransferase [Salinivirgaceae bacterium]|jgi:ribosomal-protein-alanine N-acetyltransferase|nr:GNAT family N-acetyltransferase [Salinivirgaceae bacterium]
MRKANQEINDKAQIEEILKQSTVCRIAMMDSDVPYIVPFNYGFIDGVMYMHSAKEGKKIELLEKNNKVCFEIEQKADVVTNDIACKWATAYRSVIGYGTIDFLMQIPDKKKALDIIMRHNGAKANLGFEEKQIEAVAILKLTIDSISAKQSSNWGEVHEIKGVNFESERLMLKEAVLSDLENIHNLHSVPEVDEFNTLGIPESIEETKSLLKSGIDQKMDNPRGSFHWCIFNKQSGEFIGMAGMFLSNDKFKLGEIYYKFLPKYWGKGYATEVAKRLIKLGFVEFKLHKVEAGVAVGNDQSVKVLEKSGMIREGLRRKILPIRGDWVDNYHYAIVENDATE